MQMSGLNTDCTATKVTQAIATYPKPDGPTKRILLRARVNLPSVSSSLSKRDTTTRAVPNSLANAHG